MWLANHIALILSSGAAVVASIAAIYAVKKDRRALTLEDHRMFQTRVLRAIKESTLVDDFIKTARDVFETQLNDKLQVQFQLLVSRSEFLGAIKRLETIEGQMSQLIRDTGNVSGKIDTLLRLQQ